MKGSSGTVERQDASALVRSLFTVAEHRTHFVHTSPVVGVGAGQQCGRETKTTTCVFSKGTSILLHKKIIMAFNSAKFENR